VVSRANRERVELKTIGRGERIRLRPHGPEACNLTVRLLRCDHIY
jgi:hypothetical protein